MDIDFRRTLKEQGVASLQHHIAWRLVDALATAGHSHKCHVVVALEGRSTDGGVDQATAENDVCRAQLAVLIHLAHRKYVVVGVHQSVALFQIQHLVYLPGKDQSVAAHDEFIVGNGRSDIVVMHNFYQTAAPHFVKPRLGNGLADMGIVGGNKQFDGIVASRLKG